MSVLLPPSSDKDDGFKTKVHVYSLLFTPEKFVACEHRYFEISWSSGDRRWVAAETIYDNDGVVSQIMARVCMAARHEHSRFQDHPEALIRVTLDLNDPSPIKHAKTGYGYWLNFADPVDLSGPARKRLQERSDIEDNVLLIEQSRKVAEAKSKAEKTCDEPVEIPSTYPASWLQDQK